MAPHADQPIPAMASNGANISAAAMAAAASPSTATIVPAPDLAAKPAPAAGVMPTSTQDTSPGSKVQ